MGNLADRIEEYLKRILEQTDEGYIILQRSVLADVFSCAPSQINYVLDTRFTVERGYLVESRRGGGGHLRIVRLVLSTDGQFEQVMRQLVGDQLTPERAFGLIERLQEEGLLSGREAAVLKTVFSRESLDKEVANPDVIRARLMKRILTTLAREDLE
ncbi:CtsR family transcriptional regulator [Paradesulfitobacterium aromaticivorans]